MKDKLLLSKYCESDFHIRRFDCLVSNHEDFKKSRFVHVYSNRLGIVREWVNSWMFGAILNSHSCNVDDFKKIEELKRI